MSSDSDRQEMRSKLELALARHCPGFEQLIQVDRLTSGASQETYRLLVRLNGTAALLTYDMLSSPRVMWSMEIALAVGPQRGNQNA